MGWGGDEYQDQASHPTFPSPAHELNFPANIVFFTSSEAAREYCKKLCSDIRLAFGSTRIAHDADDNLIQELVSRARLVIIVTCRESLDNGSPAQRREQIVSEIAIKRGVRIAILANENHEAVQDHLGFARGTMPLVIVNVNNNHFGGGFMDSFPMRTQFVERGETPEHIEQIAEELRKRASTSWEELK